MEEELKKKDTEKEKKKEVNINIQNIDISELKRVAKNIIEGKEEVLDKGIGAEIASIILELKNAKAKYENFINSIVSTRRTLPKIEEHLKDINEITTKSTDTLFNVIDSFNHFYEEFLIEIDNMKKYVDEGNIKEVTDKLNYYGTSISEYVTLALKIYEALEFEDITSQKINRILKLVSDVTARFGSILGYIKNKKKTDYVLLSQEEINNILKNMGLE
jgi:chemotaxis protein CheZ